MDYVDGLPGDGFPDILGMSSSCDRELRNSDMDGFNRRKMHPKAVRSKE